MRENAAAKARRLLVEGRVHLRRVHGDHVIARVRGDSAEVYEVEHTPGREWVCTCPARSRCSHASAVMLVTIVNGTEQ